MSVAKLLFDNLFSLPCSLLASCRRGASLASALLLTPWLCQPLTTCHATYVASLGLSAVGASTAIKAIFATFVGLEVLVFVYLTFRQNSPKSVYHTMDGV